MEKGIPRSFHDIATEILSIFESSTVPFDSFFVSTNVSEIIRRTKKVSYDVSISRNEKREFE